MKNKVMVCRIRTGALFVGVPIVLNGGTLLCVFITRKGELARVGIFDTKPRDVGPLWIFESYTRRTVPAAAIVDARARALDAIAAFDTEPQTELEPSFAFAADVATDGGASYA
jgi:hypothetical protein